MMRRLCVWGICETNSASQLEVQSKTQKTHWHLIYWIEDLLHPLFRSVCLSLLSFSFSLLRFLSQASQEVDSQKLAATNNDCSLILLFFSSEVHPLLPIKEKEKIERKRIEKRRQRDNVYEWHLLSLSLICSFSGGKKRRRQGLRKRKREREGNKKWQTFHFACKFPPVSHEEGKWKAKFPPLCSVDPFDATVAAALP